MIELLERAATVARSAHAGQVDKAGHDYFTAHVRDVVDRLAAGGWGVPVLIVGYLHDVLEDTDVTEDELRETFPAEVVEAVVAITRRAGEQPDDYYARVGVNRLALIVKLHGDIASNTDPQRVALLDPGTRKRLQRKYAHAIRVLTDQEEEA